MCSVISPLVQALKTLEKSKDHGSQLLNIFFTKRSISDESMYGDKGKEKEKKRYDSKDNFFSHHVPLLLAYFILGEVKEENTLKYVYFFYFII